MNTTFLLCDESLEAILTAVYDAYQSHLGHSNIHIAYQAFHQSDLFSDERVIITDESKAERVADSIRRKISPRAWEMVYRASLSTEESRAEDIYRFLVGGFYYGRKVTTMLAEPAVQRIHELNRAVGNEAHLYKEFLRFESLPGSILFARFRPKNDVISLVTPHFSNRLSCENFLIVDTSRSVAAVHPAQIDLSIPAGSNVNWYLRSITPEQLALLQSNQDDMYRSLWKTFYDSIAIEQRWNPALQRNRMPLRYREYAPEFEK